MQHFPVRDFESEGREINLSQRSMWTSVFFLCGWLVSANVQAQLDDSSFLCDYSGLFAFGDSMTDTGNADATFPGQYYGLELPYGETYFGKPAERASDGRLVIDFIAQAMRYPFLSPYLRSIRVNYRNGANFAASGATALPSKSVPFYLGLQFDWFKRFKTLVSTFSGDAVDDDALPDKTIFENALYYVSIGGNDYFESFYNGNLSINQIKTIVVPAVVTSIKHILEGLYSEGARNFMVVNVPAQGCSPMLLAKLATQVDQSRDFDGLGCSKPHNEVAALHNYQLKKVVDKFYSRHANLTIVYADYYAVNYEVITNPKNYGITNTFQACCGVGPSPYNVNPLVRCGEAPKLINGKFETTSVCDEPDTYVNWDGIHFTDAMHEVVARAFLSGQYLQPANGTSILQKCNFDISSF